MSGMNASIQDLASILACEWQMRGCKCMKADFPWEMLENPLDGTSLRRALPKNPSLHRHRNRLQWLRRCSDEWMEGWCVAFAQDFRDTVWCFWAMSMVTKTTITPSQPFDLDGTANDDVDSLMVSTRRVFDDCHMECFRTNTMRSPTPSNGYRGEKIFVFVDCLLRWNEFIMCDGGSECGWLCLCFYRCFRNSSKVNRKIFSIFEMRNQFGNEMSCNSCSECNYLWFESVWMAHASMHQ